MKPLIALALSIAVLVGLWVYLSIGIPALQLIPWIGFVAWATFFAAGGGNAAIARSLVPAIVAVLLTAATLYAVGLSGGGLIAMIVLIAVLAFILVAMAGHSALAYTPAAFLGAATYFGSGGKIDASIAFVIVTWIAGVAFGYVSESIGKRLTRTA